MVKGRGVEKFNSKAKNKKRSENPNPTRLRYVMGRRYQTDGAPAWYSRRILMRSRIRKILATMSTMKPADAAQITNGESKEKGLCMVGEPPLKRLPGKERSITL